jgi:hypothetical protein
MRIAATLSALALLGAWAVMPGTSNAATASSPAPVAEPKAPRAPSSGSQTNTSAPRQPSLKGCNKQADARNLTGRDRATFVKDCEAGKTS